MPAPILLAALFGTGSRGGLGFLVVGIAALMFFNVRRRAWSAYITIVPLGLGLIGLRLMTADHLLERLMSVQQGADGMRSALIRGSWELFRQSPFVGYGVNYTENLGRLLGAGRIAAHNGLFELLLPFGLIGALPWLMAVGGALWMGLRYRQSFWGGMIASLLVAFLAFSVVGTLRHEVFWVVLALAFRLPLHARASSPRLEFAIND